MYKKGVSFILTISFLFSLMINFTFVNADIAGDIFIRLNISNNIGEIVESFKGSGKQKVICIEDLHCDPSVQINISKIIKEIKDKYGNEFRFIGVEGSKGAINTDILGAVPDEEIKSSIAYRHLNKGDISGPELYSILYPHTVKLFGLEDPELYKKDFLHLYNSFNYYQLWTDIFKNIEDAIIEVKPYIYPKQLKAFETMISDYENKRLDIYDYLTYLYTIAKKYNIDIASIYPMINDYYKAKTIRKDIDPNMLNDEIGYIIKNLKPKLTRPQINHLDKFKDISSIDYITYLRRLINQKYIKLSTEYDTVSQYFLYLDLLDRIDNVKFLQEESDLRYRLKLALAESFEDAKRLVYCDHFLKKMYAYFDTKASSVDVIEWQNNRDAFFEAMQTFGSLLTSINYFKEHERLLKTINKNMDEFYKLADKRNELFLSNLLKESEASPVKVIIFGGYHTNGMKEFLRSRNISFDIIIPEPGKSYSRRLYLNRINEQAKLFGLTNKTSSKDTDAARFIMVMTRFQYPNFNVQLFSEVMNEYIIKVSVVNDFIDILNQYQADMEFREDIADKILWQGVIDNQAKVIFYDSLEQRFKLEAPIKFERLEELAHSLSFKYTGPVIEDINNWLTDYYIKVIKSKEVLKEPEINNLDSSYNIITMHIIEKYMELELSYLELSLHAYRDRTIMQDFKEKLETIQIQQDNLRREIDTYMFNFQFDNKERYIWEREQISKDFENIDNLQQELRRFIDTNQANETNVHTPSQKPLLDFSFVDDFWDDVKYLNTRSKFLKNINRINKETLRKSLIEADEEETTQAQENALSPLFKEIFPNMSTLTFGGDKDIEFRYLRTMRESPDEDAKTIWLTFLETLNQNAQLYCADKYSIISLIAAWQTEINNTINLLELKLIELNAERPQEDDQILRLEREKRSLRIEISKLKKAVTEDCKRLAYIYDDINVLLILENLSTTLNSIHELGENNELSQEFFENTLIQFERLIKLNVFKDRYKIEEIFAEADFYLKLYSQDLSSPDTKIRTKAEQILLERALLIYENILKNLDYKKIKNKDIKENLEKLRDEDITILNINDIAKNIKEKIKPRVMNDLDFSKAKQDLSKSLTPKKNQKNLKNLKKKKSKRKYSKDPKEIKYAGLTPDGPVIPHAFSKWDLSKKDPIRSLLHYLYPNLEQVLFDERHEKEFFDLLKEKEILNKLYKASLRYYRGESSYIFTQQIFIPFLVDLIDTPGIEDDTVAIFKQALINDTKRLNYIFPNTLDNFILDLLFKYATIISSYDTQMAASALLETAILKELGIVDIGTGDTPELLEYIKQINDPTQRVLVIDNLKQETFDFYKNLLETFQNMSLQDGNLKKFLKNIEIRENEPRYALPVLQKFYERYLVFPPKKKEPSKIVTGYNQLRNDLKYRNVSKNFDNWYSKEYLEEEEQELDHDEENIYIMEEMGEQFYSKPLIEEVFPNMKSVVSQSSLENIPKNILEDFYQQDGTPTPLIIARYEFEFLNMINTWTGQLAQEKDIAKKRQIQAYITNTKEALTNDMTRLTFIYPDINQVFVLRALIGCMSAMTDEVNMDTHLIEAITQTEALINQNVFSNNYDVEKEIFTAKYYLNLYSKDLNSYTEAISQNAVNILTNVAIGLYNTIIKNTKSTNIQTPNVKRVISGIKLSANVIYRKDGNYDEKLERIDDILKKSLTEFYADLEFARIMADDKEKVLKKETQAKKRKDLKYIEKEGNQIKYNEKPEIEKTGDHNYKWILAEDDNIRQLLKTLYPNTESLLFTQEYSNKAVTDLFTDQNMLEKLYTASVAYNKGASSYIFMQQAFIPFLTALAQNAQLSGERADFRKALLQDIRRLNYIFPRTRNDLIFETLISCVNAMMGEDTIIPFSRALEQTQYLLDLKIIDFDYNEEKGQNLINQKNEEAIKKQALALYNAVLLKLGNRRSFLELEIYDNKPALVMPVLQKLYARTLVFPIPEKKPGVIAQVYNEFITNLKYLNTRRDFSEWVKAFNVGKMQEKIERTEKKKEERKKKKEEKRRKKRDAEYAKGPEDMSPEDYLKQFDVEEADEEVSIPLDFGEGVAYDTYQPLTHSILKEFFPSITAAANRDIDEDAQGEIRDFLNDYIQDKDMISFINKYELKVIKIIAELKEKLRLEEDINSKLQIQRDLADLEQALYNDMQRLAVIYPGLNQLFALQALIQAVDTIESDNIAESLFQTITQTEALIKQNVFTDRYAMQKVIYRANYYLNLFAKDLQSPDLEIRANAREILVKQTILLYNRIKTNINYSNIKIPSIQDFFFNLAHYEIFDIKPQDKDRIAKISNDIDMIIKKLYDDLDIELTQSQDKKKILEKETKEKKAKERKYLREHQSKYEEPLDIKIEEDHYSWTLDQNDNIRKLITDLYPNISNLLFMTTYSNKEFTGLIVGYQMLKHLYNATIFYDKGASSYIFMQRVFIPFLVRLQENGNLPDETNAFREALLKDAKRLNYIFDDSHSLIFNTLLDYAQAISLMYNNETYFKPLSAALEEIRLLIDLGILNEEVLKNKGLDINRLQYSLLREKEADGEFILHDIAYGYNKLLDIFQDIALTYYYFNDKLTFLFGLEINDKENAKKVVNILKKGRAKHNEFNQMKIKKARREFLRFREWVDDRRDYINEEISNAQQDGGVSLSKNRDWNRNFVIRRILHELNPNMEKFIFSREYNKGEISFKMNKLIMFAAAYLNTTNPDIYPKELFFAFIQDIAVEISKTKDQKRQEILKRELALINKAIREDRGRMINIFPYYKELMILEILSTCAFIINNSVIAPTRPNIGLLQGLIIDIMQLDDLDLFRDDEINNWINIDIYTLSPDKITDLVSRIYDKLLTSIESDELLKPFESALRLDDKKDAVASKTMMGKIDNTMIPAILNLPYNDITPRTLTDTDTLIQEDVDKKIPGKEIIIPLDKINANQIRPYLTKLKILKDVEKKRIQVIFVKDIADWQNAKAFKKAADVIRDLDALWVLGDQGILALDRADKVGDIMRKLNKDYIAIPAYKTASEILITGTGWVDTENIEAVKKNKGYVDAYSMAKVLQTTLQFNTRLKDIFGDQGDAIFDGLDTELQEGETFESRAETLKKRIEDSGKKKEFEKIKVGYLKSVQLMSLRRFISGDNGILNLRDASYEEELKDKKTPEGQSYSDLVKQTPFGLNQKLKEETMIATGPDETDPSAQIVHISQVLPDLRVITQSFIIKEDGTKLLTNTALTFPPSIRIQLLRTHQGQRLLNYLLTTTIDLLEFDSFIKTLFKPTFDLTKNLEEYAYAAEAA